MKNLEPSMTLAENSDKYEEVAKQIQALFSRLKNKSLSYYDNQNLQSAIANEVSKAIINSENNEIYSAIEAILQSGDYRLIADYLHAIQSNNHFLKNLIIESLKSPEKLKELNDYRFFQKHNKDTLPMRKTIFVDELESVFDDSLDGDLVLHLRNKQMESAVKEIVERTNGNLGEYIESHYDLPGINSLVRIGLVKSIQLSDNTSVVTKRDNPDKKGRFFTEQKNIEKIVKALGVDNENNCVDLGINENGKEITLRVIRPFAVVSDKTNNSFYSLTPLQEGETLEELFINGDVQTKKEKLGDMKKILELLYSKGILWGDMAPRNIIVKEEGGKTNYYILDFEKTKVLDIEANMEQKKEHCRGPMCVEEFGATCSMEEVVECFSPYFKPSEWDITTEDSVSFQKHKRELVAIFEARGKESYTLGEYNQLELEVMKARFPLLDKDTDKIHYPLPVCFKVDHYLGPDYDRKTTELFMFAEKNNCMADAIDILNEALEYLDNRFIMRDFTSIANGGRVSNQKDCFELNVLSEIIDNFYNNIGNPDNFREIFVRNKSILDLYNSRQKALSSFNGSELALRNYEAVKSVLEEIISKVRLQIDSFFLLVATGGFGRKEITYGSDMDLIVAMAEERQDEFENICSIFKEKISELLEMDTEFFPPVYLKSFKENLKRSPNLAIDFFDSMSINNETLKDYDNILNSVLCDPEFLASASLYFKMLREQRQELTSKEIVKNALKDINFITGLRSLDGNPFVTDEHCQELFNFKKILLFQKNEYGFEDSSSRVNVLDEKLLMQIQERLDNIYREFEANMNQYFNSAQPEFNTFSLTEFENITSNFVRANIILNATTFEDIEALFAITQQQQNADTTVLKAFLVNPNTPTLIKDLIFDNIKDNEWLKDLITEHF